MKTLSLSKPLVVMMVGLPGAGKSFFARQFADTFGAPVVSHDRIRYELFTQPQYSKEEREIVGRIAQYQTEELLKTGRTFICDGGCNARGDRMTIERLAKNAGYGTLVVWVQTDLATAQFRATKRNARKTDDRYNPSLTDAQFEAQSRVLTPPAREEVVVISGKHTYNTQARVVLKKLAAPRAQEATAAHKAAETAATRPAQPPTSNRRSVTVR